MENEAAEVEAEAEPQEFPETQEAPPAEPAGAAQGEAANHSRHLRKMCRNHPSQEQTQRGDCNRFMSRCFRFQIRAEGDDRGGNLRADEARFWPARAADEGNGGRHQQHVGFSAAQREAQKITCDQAFTHYNTQTFTHVKN